MNCNHVVGTGGIGSGVFFSLKGEETLGRNESRMATLMPYRDYCKQHIILHYLSVLLDAGNNFEVFPVGKVGDDEHGRQLLKMMEAAGMKTSSIGISQERSTMYSVCFQYPDHSGGNITTDESACSEVSPADIDLFFATHTYGGKGIVLAAPEVPIETRIHLLQNGRERGYLNISSVLSGEVDEFIVKKGIALADILSINTDEAKHIAHLPDGHDDVEKLVDECVRVLREHNPSICVLITNGSKGVYTIAPDSKPVLTPGLPMNVVSTAGAGDAFLSGYIAGIVCGLQPSKRSGDSWFGQTPLHSAVELGILTASMSVTSADTINFTINATTLHEFIRLKNLKMNSDFEKLFSSDKQF